MSKEQPDVFWKQLEEQLKKELRGQLAIRFRVQFGLHLQGQLIRELDLQLGSKIPKLWLFLEEQLRYPIEEELAQQLEEEIE